MERARQVWPFADDVGETLALSATSMVGAARTFRHRGVGDVKSAAICAEAMEQGFRGLSAKRRQRPRGSLPEDRRPR
jgi:hypothetical protein